MSESLDTARIHEQLDDHRVQAALVGVCTHAETVRRRGEPLLPPGAAGDEVRGLLDRLYRICVDDELIEEYALLYEATRYVPHGSLIQPMLEMSMRKYTQLLAHTDRGHLSEADKDVIRIFIQLSLEAYDKLGSFRVFLHEFREFIPFSSLPKAISIARALNDEQAIAELTDNLLHPPAELDESAKKRR